MSAADLPAPPHVSEWPAAFFGWRIVAAAFAAQFISNGVTFAAFGALVIPLSDDFGASRGVIASGPGLAILTMGLFGPLIGRIVDRGHVRTTMLVGVLPPTVLPG